MNYLLIRHRVQDCQQWKKGFDQSEELRHEYGIGHGWINRNMDDPNEIVLMIEIESVARTREFFTVPEIRQLIDSATIVGNMEMTFLEVLSTVPSAQVAYNAGEEI